MTSTATLTQKPKLTGWAQAAARAQPKPVKTQVKMTAIPIVAKSNNEPVVVAAQTVTGDAAERISSKKPKKINRQPYNRDEVKTFMNKLFQQSTSNKPLTSYRQLVNDNAAHVASNWGSVDKNKNKNKNKKYGCLNDISKVLKN